MAFGFGGSKNKAKSTTDVTDISGSSGGSQFDQGYGSTGFEGGSNQYDSGADFSQSVWGPQGGALGDYYSQMQNMWGNFMGPGGGMSGVQGSAGGASDFMNRISQGGAGGMEALLAGGQTGAAGAGISPELMASLTSSLSGPSSTGQMYEDIVGGSGNTYIDPMIDRMRSDVAERQGLDDMQGKSLASGAGQQGSSRQGVADYLRSKDMNKNLGDREAAARAGAYDTDLDWKMKIAEQADLGRGQAQDRAIGLLSGGDANVLAGTGAGESMQNLGMGQMAPWMQAAMMPFQMGGMYGNMLGGPTVLGGGSQYGTGGGSYGSGYEDTGFGSGSSDYDAFREYMAQQEQKSSGGSLSLGF